MNHKNMITDILQKLDKIDESQYGKISKKLNDIITNAEKAALTFGRKKTWYCFSNCYLHFLPSRKN